MKAEIKNYFQVQLLLKLLQNIFILILEILVIWKKLNFNLI